MNNIYKELNNCRKKKKARRLLDIDVDEISVVTKPAMPSAVFIIRKEDEDAAESLRSGLSEILSDAGPNLPKLPDAAAIIGKYIHDYPDDVRAGIQSFAAAILEIIDAAPAPASENNLKAAEKVGKSESDWPSLGTLTIPLLGLVNPKLGSRLLQKATEEEDPDPLEKKINRLISENERLRASRSPSSQKSAEFDGILKAEDDDLEDRWPSLNLFGY